MNKCLYCIASRVHLYLTSSCFSSSIEHTAAQAGELWLWPFSRLCPYINVRSTVYVRIVKYVCTYVHTYVSVCGMRIYQPLNWTLSLLTEEWSLSSSVLQLLVFGQCSPEHMYTALFTKFTAGM